jgi:hypothetical protein
MSQLVRTNRQANFKDFKRFGTFNGLVEQKNSQISKSLQPSEGVENEHDICIMNTVYYNFINNNTKYKHKKQWNYKC